MTATPATVEVALAAAGIVMAAAEAVLVAVAVAADQAVVVAWAEDAVQVVGLVAPAVGAVPRQKSPGASSRAAAVAGIAIEAVAATCRPLAPDGW
jgi:hypothetical protein